VKLSVVIPAHNEENHIQGVVGELRQEFIKEKIDFDIIIVNDNSKDMTGELSDDLARKYNDVRVVHRSGNNGFGRAVRDGLKSVSGDCVIVAMADKSDAPEDAVKIFRKLEEGYDVVYGSRFIRGSKVYRYPLLKLIINRLANHFIRALFLIRENDITNAFKGYNMRVIKTLWPLDAIHFNITAELPLKARINGFSKTAVPVKWYGRESGVSKLSIIRMGQRYLRTVLGIWFMWIWNIRPKSHKEKKIDEHWEAYWKEKEDSTFLGRLLFVFREKFWVNSFTKFAMEFTGKGKVLEAGSGSALSSIFLSKKRNDDITALDISMSALHKARESSIRHNVRVKLINGDIYRMPFADKAFDLVWNSGTLEHFSNPIPILKEMMRVGGNVICIVPAKGPIFSLISKASGLLGTDFKSYFIREDEIFYSIESLSNVLKQAGFTEIHVNKIYCVRLFPYIAAYCKS